IENNGRRIGFASANEMLTFYRKTYKRAPKDAEKLNPFEIGILYPESHPSRNGHVQVEASATDGARVDSSASDDRPEAPLSSATDSPGTAGATSGEAAAKVAERTDDEKARRRAESQERARLMAQLAPAVKMRVARREMTLAQALT